jgi:hypothetical protein
VKKIALCLSILLTSATVFAACELGCFTFPNLYKPFTNTYPCANGNFQYQPYYADNTEGNNVTLTFQPTAGGTLSNIVNAQGTSITWTHNGNVWTGHPTNFVAHGLYSWALYASGSNCTIQGKAQ